MRYLFIPDKSGPWQNASGQRGQCSALAETATVTGPRIPILADSEEAAAALAGLAAVPVPAERLESARRARQAQIGAQLRTDLLAVFESWTVGEQYDFDGARQALNADLQAGDLARAIAGVTTFRPADSTLAGHRAQVLSVLGAADTRLAALLAATTLAEVEAA